MKSMALLTLAFCAACAGSPTAPTMDSAVGRWAGVDATGVVVELSVTSDASGVLAGCVAFGFDQEYRPQDRVRVAIVGTVTGHAISLEVPATQAIAWSFDGTLVGNSMTGTAEGSRLTLSRAANPPSC